MLSKSLDRKTILAVDDRIENLKVLIKYLEDSGFEIMVAQSGEEALKHVESIIPDIILLDVLMPGINGFETCRRLKENETTKEIPVIFMTALTDTVDKVKGFEVGAVDYLTKPLQHEEVSARVNAHLTIRQYQRQLQRQNVSLQQKNIQLEEQRQELRESEARFRGLSEATFEGILIHDEGRIVDGNQTLEAMFDYKRDEMIGGNALNFLTPEFRDLVLHRIRTKDETPYEAKGLKKDGTIFPIAIQAKTMPYQGRDVRVVAVRDLTQQKRMEEEKARIQQEQLTFSMETLGFVTHELKSPLASMQMMVSMMLEGYAGEVPDKIETYLLRIRRNCEEFQDMVRNYLDISRMGMGELVARKTPINYYTDVVEPCVEHVQLLFKSREINLMVVCDKNLIIQADQELLRIALTNYLNNAAKYGASKTETRLTVSEEDGMISTAVWNEGAGFNQEEQASLFLKFSRLHNENTIKRRGSGLGLYLTKHIITLHGGKVWAESVPGQWANFCYSIPIHDEEMIQEDCINNRY